MQSAVERNRNDLPLGELGIVALESCRELGRKIDQYIAG